MDLELKGFLFELKKEFPNIFLSTIKGEEFIFRPLSKYEFDELVLDTNINEQEQIEAICYTATLYPDPEEYDFSNCEYAGIPDTLANDIIEKSVFGNVEDIDEMINEKRSRTENNTDLYIENVILMAFSHITPEDLKHWDFYKTIDYFTRAEWIINNTMPQYSLPEKGQAPQVSRNGVEKEVESQKTFSSM